MIKNKIVIFLILSLIVRILLGYFVPVFGDEAYYYIWSLHPQLSYFDHPPMVSYFIYISHLVFPSGNPFSLRAVFIAAGFLTSLIWLKILRNRGWQDSSIFCFLALMFLNPLLGPGSVLATPDTPLVFFWSLSYLCFENILRKRTLKWYAFLGISLGLGFCSKYHIVLFVFSGLLYLLFSKRFRDLRIPGILLTLVTGFIFSLPVLIWNADNEWASFVFQINHGFGESTFEWSWPAGFLVAQFLIINPFLFFSLFRKQSGSPDRTFSWSQLAFFFTSSFKSVVEGNWPLTSHLHSTAHYCTQSDTAKIRWPLLYWALFYICFVTFLLLPQSQKVRKNLINSSQTEELVPLVEQFKPLYGPSYQVSALLTWQSGRLVPKLNELSRVDFFDSLPESRPDDYTVFYVLKNDYSDWPAKYEIYTKTKVMSFDNTGLELYQFKYE